MNHVVKHYDGLQFDDFKSAMIGIDGQQFNVRIYAENKVTGSLEWTGSSFELRVPEELTITISGVKLYPHEKTLEDVDAEGIKKEAGKFAATIPKNIDRMNGYIPPKAKCETCMWGIDTGTCLTHWLRDTPPIHIPLIRCMCEASPLYDKDKIKGFSNCMYWKGRPESERSSDD